MAVEAGKGAGARDKRPESSPARGSVVGPRATG
eukprot:CAMPEP_0174282806 /NCGR_PEP_ID=MMETSP0809-20121228/3383_1 /TAXON_ID=73025 ORGANISM="Eutreptiella gymnastica-like, Strain CCMP1594" /NCGR_SAMPLE_ID=MMETSP0809 /ASSEMBLY_ACC=CAM_ASM_000658 /LENGTH=32 /DNA_ID= /DNA_START= /DNA_END= /DNA_ORIENTATION=